MKIIAEPKELIARYVSRMIPHAKLPLNEFAAVGLLNGDDELVAGAIFTGYAPPNILMHVAIEQATTNFITALMHYAFVQISCKRITGVIEAHNQRSQLFAEKLGARLEGVMIDAGPAGDLCIYGLLKADAQRWLTARNLKKLEESLEWA